MPVADRLIVLTFDDGVKSQVSFVAPLLKKLGFGATFYTTDDERFHGERYLTWEEAKGLNDDGFEIGNHLGAHTDVTRLSAEEFARQVEQVERRCEAYGIERPVTFCYPGYHNNREAVEVLAEKGYILPAGESLPSILKQTRATAARPIFPARIILSWFPPRVPPDPAGALTIWCGRPGRQRTVPSPCSPFTACRMKSIPGSTPIRAIFSVTWSI